MTDLTEKHCLPCEGGVPTLNEEKIKKLLADIPGWQLNEKHNRIQRRFEFKNFYRTMSFVNVIAHIANQENHHPDIMLGYNYCEVHYTTHAIAGLSENDFICAAKINKVIEIAG